MFWKYRTLLITSYKLGKAIGVGVFGNVVCRPPGHVSGQESGFAQNMATLLSMLIYGKVLFLVIHVGGGHVSFPHPSHLLDLEVL